MKVLPDWHAEAAYSEDGPSVNELHRSADLRVVLVALAAGQALPVHPGPAACFHFLSGHGVMIVDDERREVEAGATVIAPPGSRRGVEATEPVVFLGNLGDPDSEGGPH